MELLIIFQLIASLQIFISKWFLSRGEEEDFHGWEILESGSRNPQNNYSELPKTNKK
jgi:hypothetical protein